MAARYLIDTSAAARWPKPAVAARLDRLAIAGELAICAVTALELGFSARSGDDHQRLIHQLAHAYSWVPAEDRSARRALQVQGDLARQGQHRTVRLPDLLVAAIAEQSNLVVLHYDRDFDRVAAATGQACEWVVPPGTADA
jgi:predicted nucleic acid-binding protein